VSVLDAVDLAVFGTEVELAEPREAGGLADLYLRHSDDAIRLAYLLTGDRALAEDLVQDAFVKLAGRLVHLRDPGAFDAYLRRTVVNLANSHFRRKRLERAYLKRERGGLVTEETLPDPGPRDELWEAMSRLSPRQRAAIVLRFYEDLSEQRVAEILKCRPGTVKSLVSRGLAVLRGEIEHG
jgi:RNA polymerase sigma-70 factor (sigma-E family)